MAILVLQLFIRVFKLLLPLPHATSQLLPNGVIRLTIPMPVNPIARRLWKTWTPGSHVRITIRSIGLLQPHPFTIASLPTDKQIQLYIRAKAGFTQRLYEKTAAAAITGSTLSTKVHFEGIYSAKFPNFSKFDVVLLISSGIGVTFTIPILKDIVERVKVIQQREGDCRCKRIGFVWIVKHQGMTFNGQV
jgi:predicted ferric reductase